MRYSLRFYWDFNYLNRYSFALKLALYFSLVSIVPLLGQSSNQALLFKNYSIESDAKSELIELWKQSFSPSCDSFNVSRLLVYSFETEESNPIYSLTPFVLIDSAFIKGLIDSNNIVVSIDSVDLFITEKTFWEMGLEGSLKYTGMLAIDLSHDEYETCLNSRGIVPTLRFTIKSDGTIKLVQVIEYNPLSGGQTQPDKQSEMIPPK